MSKANAWTLSPDVRESILFGRGHDLHTMQTSKFEVFYLNKFSVKIYIIFTNSFRFLQVSLAEIILKIFHRSKSSL